VDAQTLIQTLTIQCGYTGHIVDSRGATLEVLGQERPFPADKYARYVRGSDEVVGAEGTVPLSEMVADFAATADGLKAGLAALTSVRLVEKAPFSPMNDEKETIGSLMAGMAFHEAYHCGQLGVLRRMAGAEGIIK